MCGIVGAISERNVVNILLEGLKRLEYRGYDSAGIAVLNTQKKNLERLRVSGKVSSLEDALMRTPINGLLGIAHTRWATHGQPNTANAHPHFSHDEIAVVHNGIIENFEPLRERLKQQGYEFHSETDTEVIAHLIHFYFHKSNDLFQSIQQAAKELKGAYSLGILSKYEPNTLYGVKIGSPLVVGIGIDEHFLASDPVALLPVTQRFVYLEEGDIVKVQKTSFEIWDKAGNAIERKVFTVDSQIDGSNKGKFRHFMLKEIFEQPEALLQTFDGYLQEDKILPQAFGHDAAERLAKIHRVQIVACGTSYHAGLVARHWFESIAGIPCQVEIASENRYRSVVVEPDCLLIAISQSGETADTLAALRRGKELGYATTLGICNVPHSSLMRETDLAFITRAGTEIGVAATKTFTAQLSALLMLAVTLGQRNQEPEQKIKVKEIIDAMLQLPSLIRQTLALDHQIRSIAKRFIDKQHALFLGRGELFPIALEGALKLKEISYIHAEAYPAGELKHGPLALIDKDMPVIVLAPHNVLFEKLISNVHEVLARGGELFIFSDESSFGKSNSNGSYSLIEMPPVPEVVSSIVYTIPMQLLSYYVAVLKGTDVDQPRNLAKSVTVE